LLIFHSISGKWDSPRIPIGPRWCSPGTTSCTIIPKGISPPPHSPLVFFSKNQKLSLLLSFVSKTSPMSINCAAVFSIYSNLNLTLLLDSSQELEAKNIALAHVRICYSPFSRTRHTANLVASFLNLPFEGPQCKVSHNYSTTTTATTSLSTTLILSIHILHLPFHSSTNFPSLFILQISFIHLSISYICICFPILLLFCLINGVSFTKQVIEDLRERYFGPSFELLSHDKVSHAQRQFLQLSFLQFALICIEH